MDCVSALCPRRNDLLKWDLLVRSRDIGLNFHVKQLIQIFSDSKQLSEEKREKLFEDIKKATEFVGWSVEILSPSFISTSMLARCDSDLLINSNAMFEKFALQIQIQSQCIISRQCYRSSETCT